MPVTTTAWGRSLADAATRAGDDASPDSVAPPGQILDTCTIANRRPRDLETYQAACAAVTLGAVSEHDAVETQDGWLLWHMGAFRTVRFVVRNGGEIELEFDDGARRFCSTKTAVYRHTA